MSDEKRIYRYVPDLGQTISICIPQGTEYDKQAERFLHDTGTVFSYRLIGDDCPIWCDGKKHAHGQHFEITLTRGNKSERFSYWNSLADTKFYHYGRISVDDYPKENARFAILRAYTIKNNILVRPYDFFSCLICVTTTSFDDFCMEYGYSNDSIKAHKTWLACLEQDAKLNRLFSQEEKERLSDIQ